MNANRCAPGLRTALAPATTNLSATLARTKAPFAATTRLLPYTFTRSFQDGPRNPFDGPPRGPRFPPGQRRPGPGSAPQNKGRSAFDDWAAEAAPSKPLFRRGPAPSLDGRPPGPNRYQGGHRPPGPNRYQGGPRPPFGDRPPGPRPPPGSSQQGPRPPVERQGPGFAGTPKARVAPKPRYQRHARTGFDEAPEAEEAKPAGPPGGVTAPEIMIGEDGVGLKGPFRTAAILRDLNPETHELRQVAPGTDGVPICKVFDLAAEAAARAAREEREKARLKAKAKHKIVEISWAIADNDLALKGRRVKEFLENGFRVEVVLLPRKRGRKASEAECEELIGRVRGVFGEVEGAKEARKPDGEVGKTLRMFVEKPAKV